MRVNTTRYANLGKFIEEFLDEVRKAADEKGDNVRVAVNETETDLGDQVKRRLR